MRLSDHAFVRHECGRPLTATATHPCLPLRVAACLKLAVGYTEITHSAEPSALSLTAPLGPGMPARRVLARSFIIDPIVDPVFFDAISRMHQL